MKRLNYYQVHKNKKPKIVFEQQHKYVKYMLAMAKKSVALTESLISIQYSIDSFFNENKKGDIGDEIKIVSVEKKSSCGKTEQLN